MERTIEFERIVTYYDIRRIYTIEILMAFHFFGFEYNVKTADILKILLNINANHISASVH